MRPATLIAELTRVRALKTHWESIHAAGSESAAIALAALVRIDQITEDLEAEIARGPVRDAPTPHRVQHHAPAQAGKGGPLDADVRRPSPRRTQNNPR